MTNRCDDCPLQDVCEQYNIKQVMPEECGEVILKKKPKKDRRV